MSYPPHVNQTPRPVSFLLKLRLMLYIRTMVTGLSFLVMCAILIPLFVSFSGLGAALRFNGQELETSGILKDMTETNSSLNDDRIYRYTYSYMVDGIPYSGYSLGSHRALGTGDTLRVIYQPEKPSLSRIKNMRLTLFPVWTNLVALALPFLGFALCLAGYRQFKRHAYLVRHGILVAGTISHKEETSISVDEKTVYKIHFEFKTPDGSLYQSYERSHRLERLVSEDVLYDPQNPSSAVLLDLLPKQVRSSLL